MKAFHSKNLKYREIVSGDLPFLRKMLYEALFVPEGKNPYPRNVLKIPEIARYIEDWGKSGDFGIISFWGPRPVGAAWCRLFNAKNKGFGFLDERTPELTVAVDAGFRSQGIGATLLKKLFVSACAERFEAISLSVDQRNRAANLYRRLGFEVVRNKKKSFTMRKSLRGNAGFADPVKNPANKTL